MFAFQIECLTCKVGVWRELDAKEVALSREELADTMSEIPFLVKFFEEHTGHKVSTGIAEGVRSTKKEYEARRKGLQNREDCSNLSLGEPMSDPNPSGGFSWAQAPAYTYRVAGRLVAQPYQSGSTEIAWVTPGSRSLKEALQQMRQAEDAPKQNTFVSRELWLWGYYDNVGPTSAANLYAYFKDRNDGGMLP